MKGIIPNRVFLFCYIIIAFLSALYPKQAILMLILPPIFYLFVFRTKRFFILLSIILLIQHSLIITYYRFGLTVRESMIIGRIDDVIWIVLLLMVLLKFKDFSGEFKLSSIDYSIFLLLLLSFISMIINNRNFFWAAVSTYRMLKGYLIFFIAAKLKFQKNDIEYFLKVYIFSLFLIALIGIFQNFGLYLPFFPPGFRLGTKVISSIFTAHTAFGTMMVIGAILSLSFITEKGRDNFFPLLAIFIICIFLSTSRRSIISFSLILLLLPLLTKNVTKKIYIPIAIFSAIILIIFKTQLGVLITDTLLEYIEQFSNTPRGQLYIGALKILKAKFFFGEGPGSFAGLISKLTMSGVYKKYGLPLQAMRFSTDAYPPHIFGELGFLGGVSYILFLFIAFKKIKEIENYFRHSGDKLLTSLSLYLKAVFIVAVVESFVSSFWEVSMKTFAFWGILGMITSYFRRVKINAGDTSH